MYLSTRIRHFRPSVPTRVSTEKLVCTLAQFRLPPVPIRSGEPAQAPTHTKKGGAPRPSLPGHSGGGRRRPSSGPALPPLLPLRPRGVPGGVGWGWGGWVGGGSSSSPSRLRIHTHSLTRPPTHSHSPSHIRSPIHSPSFDLSLSVCSVQRMRLIHPGPHSGANCEGAGPRRRPAGSPAATC